MPPAWPRKRQTYTFSQDIAEIGRYFCCVIAWSDETTGMAGYSSPELPISLASYRLCPIPLFKNSCVEHLGPCRLPPCAEMTPSGMACGLPGLDRMNMASAPDRRSHCLEKAFIFRSPMTASISGKTPGSNGSHQRSLASHLGCSTGALLPGSELLPLTPASSGQPTPWLRVRI